ncbi:hypothetical protein BC477_05535 [Clavibacter michiganensis subsp. michiganensis]|uniref:Uncharacterized protein n=1 Tax=Clavibacter michiganensis subsp. michiganensis TaxID=33013 RepID=A0A251XLV9_CLAMM|nr:hypothetical protein BC477_05535 [Clavibacter michiganensis subsp. michiganensis]OUE04179.1 hypothetical protein CMMCAS07_04465 [Clavibacter michiganensis subsp. michiganensis]
MTDSGTGGNIATYGQMRDPVKPVTRVTPRAAAAFAVSFSSSAARWRTPSAWPSPQTLERRIAWCRKSIGSSHTAWPVRCCESACTWRPWRSRISRRPRRYAGSSAARHTSRCSAEHAISRASKPQPLASRATSSSGRSAHWPVKSATGW